METPCGTCPKPELDSGNLLVWEVFTLIKGQVKIAGMGGVSGFDYSVVPAILSSMKVPQTQWVEVFSKLEVISSVAVKLWNKNTEAG